MKRSFRLDRSSDRGCELDGCFAEVYSAGAANREEAASREGFEAVRKKTEGGLGLRDVVWPDGVWPDAEQQAEQREQEAQVQAKTAYKSFRYKNNLVWNSARRGKTSAPGKPDVDIGSPPEFKGESSVWSPEELLVASLNACLMLTFISMAQVKRLDFVSYESEAEGLLENVDGKYRITKISVHPNLTLKSDSDVEVAKTIMDKVEENCFISNSIASEVELIPQFRLADGAR